MSATSSEQTHILSFPVNDLAKRVKEGPAPLLPTVHFERKEIAFRVDEHTTVKD